MSAERVHKTGAELRKEGVKLLRGARGEAGGISVEDYTLLKGTSAVAASGADLAHEAGIFGEGVRVLLLEDSGINHTDMQKVVSAGSTVETAGGFPFKTDHGSAMASLINAVAPKSNITVKHVADLATSVEGVRIINASFGGDSAEGFKNTFVGVVGSGALIVKSAGNSQQNLSTDAYTQNCGVLLPLTIFAGNLRQDYKGKTSSGVPGANPAIQNSFLWVVADDVLTAYGPNGSAQYSPTTGTSNAAAILSGAAALILSKYPGLSTAELKVYKFI